MRSYTSVCGGAVLRARFDMPFGAQRHAPEAGRSRSRVSAILPPKEKLRNSNDMKGRITIG
ncbi:hypothetical protein [Mycoplana sp. MJR14]|uniref:hypothetical protein n=1 Tax=Mycoplana sp. MJR14 TaxID=3032583 RepID=UPI0011D0B499|nr:hypothetical protein [Mycoplana sp. MJR14]MDF1632502.1 hypothetical protein [Mycoplana sp. MJR14]